MIFLVESVEEEEEEVEMEEEDDEESEESDGEDVFVPKEFVELRTDDVEKSYCIEEEVGRYSSCITLAANVIVTHFTCRRISMLAFPLSLL